MGGAIPPLPICLRGAVFQLYLLPLTTIICYINCISPLLGRDAEPLCPVLTVSVFPCNAPTAASSGFNTLTGHRQATPHIAHTQTD